MQVTVKPAHCILDCNMKIPESICRWYLNSAPDRRVGFFEGNLELVDLLCRWHTKAPLVKVHVMLDAPLHRIMIVAEKGMRIKAGSVIGWNGLALYGRDESRLLIEASYPITSKIGVQQDFTL